MKEKRKAGMMTLGQEVHKNATAQPVQRMSGMAITVKKNLFKRFMIYLENLNTVNEFFPLNVISLCNIITNGILTVAI